MSMSLLMYPVSSFHSPCDLSTSVTVAIRWKFAFRLVASDSSSKEPSSFRAPAGVEQVQVVRRLVPPVASGLPWARPSPNVARYFHALRLNEKSNDATVEG